MLLLSEERKLAWHKQDYIKAAFKTRKEKCHNFLMSVQIKYHISIFLRKVIQLCGYVSRVLFKTLCNIFCNDQISLDFSFGYQLRN